MVHTLSRILRIFIDSQIELSKQFDRLLPAKFRIDGYRNFSSEVIPKYLREGLTIYDIGGGKNPYISADIKEKLRCTVIGIDIDPNELKLAPHGVYDKIIVSDITEYKGPQDGDLVISLALLEHVKDIEAALKGMHSCLKSGGHVAIFVPSKKALYARLNRLLPEGLKKLILFSLFPHSRRLQGFPAYYDRCTPLEIKQIALQVGYDILDEKYYYISSYFSFFLPVYVLWRIYLLIFYWFAKEQAAETFGMVLKKKS